MVTRKSAMVTRGTTGAGIEMAYDPTLGLIPGYDALWGLSSRKKAYADWEKNVGSKGRSIRYAHRRPDFGASRSAFKEIKSDVKGMLSDINLPFK